MTNHGSIDPQRAGARWRESEKLFQRAFQATPTPIVLTRLADGVIVSANEAFLKTSGYTEAEIVGQNVMSLNIYASPEQRDEYLGILRERGSVRDREQLLRTKSGAVRTILLSGEIIELDGQPHLLTAGLDITERKQAEVEMGHALAREKELSEMKSSFVSMVSHEFRTPLEVILSATDILDRYLDRLEPADRRQHLDSIQESVHRMTAMMEEVLLLGRFEAGRFHFQPDDLHLASWSRRFADEMRSATSGRGVIELVLGDFEPMVWADEKLLRHILANLVSNAVKYSAPGSTAHLNIVRDGRDAVFRVEDHGCGIPVADQTRLFEAFHRGRNVNQVPGTGLGLVIVKRAVALHGGRIEFTSEEGQGTTFTVRLPLFAETDSTNRNSP